MKIYVASSWRNSIQPTIVRFLRYHGYDVYDFRNPAPGQHGFSWSEVNPDWRQWTPEKFISELNLNNPVSARGFPLDKQALDDCDVCVCVLPCGRSAHLEAGYAAGRGKKVIFCLHPDKFEPELMYLLGDGCVVTTRELASALEKLARAEKQS